MKSILVWESIITPIVLSLIVIGLVGFFVPDIVVLAFMSLALFSTLGELALRLILNINNNSDPVFQDYQSLNVVSFFKRFGRALSSRLTEDWPDGFPNKTKAALLRFCVLLAVPFVILGNIFNVVWIAITTPMLMAITISVNLIINLPLYCLDISQWVTQMMGFVPQKLSSNPLPTETSDMSPDSGSYASINEELRNNSSLVISGAEHRPPPVSATAMIRKESEAQKHLFVPSAGMFVQTRYVLRDAVNQPLALMNEALSIENGL